MIVYIDIRIMLDSTTVWRSGGCLAARATAHQAICITGSAFQSTKATRHGSLWTTAPGANNHALITAVATVRRGTGWNDLSAVRNCVLWRTYRTAFQSTHQKSLFIQLSQSQVILADIRLYADWCEAFTPRKSPLKNAAGTHREGALAASSSA